jgi:hypothetical protein
MQGADELHSQLRLHSFGVDWRINLMEPVVLFCEQAVPVARIY